MKPVFSSSSELTKRVAVGVIGAALLVLIVLWGGWPGICLLTTVISLGMVYEYSKMIFSLPDQVEKLYAMLCVTWLIGLLNFISGPSEYEVLLVTFLGLFTYFLFSADRYENSQLQQHFKELSLAFSGLVYLAFLPLFLTRIHESAHGKLWTLLFLLIVWSGDTGAYFVGKKYGRRKLYPHISPKKTMEGGAGGLLAGLIIAILFKLFFFSALGWMGVLVVPIVVGLFSQVGDLCESFLKRAYAKKDSSSLLPGHGGFLDRFDSVLFSLPVMYACIRVFS